MGKISRMFTAEGLNTSQIHPKNSMPPKYFRASQGGVIKSFDIAYFWTVRS